MNQFQVAQQKYPSLKQEDQQTFSIIFNESPQDTYSIIYSDPNPNIAPKIQVNGVPIPTILTDNWIPLYKMVHILEHLFIRVSIPQPSLNQKIELRTEIKKAFQSANPNVASTNEGRLTILKKIPFCAEALAEKQRAIEIIDDCDSRCAILISEVSNHNSRLQELNQEQNTLKEKLQNSTCAQLQRSSQGKLNKIAQIRQNQANSLAKLNHLKEQLSTKAISVDNYLTEYAKEKEEYNYFSTLISYLQ